MTELDGVHTPTAEPTDKLHTMPYFNFEKQKHNSVFHYTPISNILWVLFNKEGLLSISSAKQQKKAIRAAFGVSVQYRNDRPEWLSVYDGDATQVSLSTVMSYNSFTILAKKSNLNIISGSAQSKLPGEIWVEHEIPFTSIEGVIVTSDLLKMTVDAYLDNNISEEEYKLAFKKIWWEVARTNENLKNQIIILETEIEKQVEAEFPNAYYMIKGTLVEQRRNKAVFRLYLSTLCQLDLKTATLADLFSVALADSNCVLWQK